MTHPSATSRRAGRRDWFGLLVVLGPVLLVSMDGSVLFLAMPRITQALAPTADEALWVLDGYGFVVGSLLIAFGNLGDRFGRFRLLMIGVAVFAAGSAGAAYAPSPEILIAFRVLMGLGGATLLPSGLAVLGELFADPRQRSRAIGIFAATFAAGFAIGPVVGGLLLSRFDWGSVFLVNLPVAAAFLVAAPFLLREVRTRRPGGVDVASIALSAGGLLLAVYSVKTLAAYGPSTEAAVAGVVGVGALVRFVLRQRVLDHPLVDVRLFRSTVFTVAIVTGVLSLVAWSAAAYLTGIYLQTVLGLPVLTAALLALPGAAVLTATCVLTPAVVDRVGPRVTLVVCHFSMAVGLLLLLATTTTGGTGWYVTSTVVAGFGYGLSFALVADTAVAAVPVDRAGSAAAIAETSNELGNALGIALLGSTAVLVFRSLGPDIAPTLGETVTAGAAGAALEQAEDAFLTGLHVAIGVAAALCAGLGLLALRWIPRRTTGDEVPA
ncbi:MFS transporter [Actinophytocola xanthii]|uniref:MFS transporter n=1 Tax=Actinophytocola xanthii TaxID=1912961 RepID=A0A1Q8C1Q6_9PSEU|nr:MFS transporter [Actinophytocola xanthii]OLF08269.1 MFS transporter [Actinophytocola xanthii]